MIKVMNKTSTKKLTSITLVTTQMMSTLKQLIIWTPNKDISTSPSLMISCNFLCILRNVL
jgi:hypothetical protein